MPPARLIACWLTAGAATAVGQTAVPDLQPPDPLRALEPGRPVEQGVEDVDPLATSLRDLRLDLREPVGFGRVYEVPGRDDMLMRVEGALYAVFPQSVYAGSRIGPVPVVPSGTVFFIGEQNMLAAMQGSTRATRPEPGPGGSFPEWAQAIDLRLHARVETLAPTHDTPYGTRAIRPKASDARRPTVVNDHRYRVSRTRALLKRAAKAASQAARGPGSSSK